MSGAHDIVAMRAAVEYGLVSFNVRRIARHKILRINGSGRHAAPFVHVIVDAIVGSGIGAIRWGCRPLDPVGAREIKPRGVHASVLRQWLLAYYDGPYDEAGITLQMYLTNAREGCRAP